MQSSILHFPLTIRSTIFFVCVLLSLLQATDSKRNPKPFLFTLFERPARKLANQLNPLTPSTETIRRRQSIAFLPTPYDDVQEGGSSSSFYLPGPKLWNGRVRGPIADSSYCGINYDCSYDLSCSRGIQWDVELIATEGQPDSPRQFQCVLYDGVQEWTCELSVPSAASTTTSLSIELPFVDFESSSGETMRTESIQRIRLLYARRGTRKRRNPTFCVGEFRLKIHALKTY